MKRALLIGLGLLISLFLVAPASAFVFVYVDVQKDKSVTVTELIEIEKTATIDVDLIVNLEGAAEAIALANQENWGGEVDGADEGTQEPESNFRSATIKESIGTIEPGTGNRGIVGVNQDAGNLNNQGNNVALAVTDALDSFANAESSASQINAANDVEALEPVENLLVDPNDIDAGVLPPQKKDLITGSIIGNLGIVGVNQSVGNANNQLNSVALAAGLAGIDVALSEADLGQLNAFNLVFEENTHKADTITNSINANHGIVGVNQSAGNMNNQANVVSVAIAHPAQ